MRTIFALAVAAATVISVPAFAQSVGAPGAVGTGGGLVGSNTPGGGASPNGDYGARPYGWARGFNDSGYYGENSQPSWSVQYNRVASPAWSNGPYNAGPGYYGEGSQPTWSVQYNRVGGY